MTKAKDCTEEYLKAVLTSRKDANHHTATWSPALAADNALIQSSLQFGVSVLEHDLLVRAEWKAETEQQIFLQFPGDSALLARLCLTGRHDGVAHWHFLEGIKGIHGWGAQIDNPPSGPGAMSELLSLFLKKMMIQNLVIQGAFSGPA